VIEWLAMDMGLSLRKQRSEPESNKGAQPPAPAYADASVTMDQFQQLYADYRNDVLRYCRYRLPSEQDAEDATQEIFLRVYRALPSWQDRGARERSWIFAIAHNEVIDRRRVIARRPQAVLDDARWLQDGQPTPEQSAIASGELGEALALLGQLSPDQRQVMELRLVGLTGVEIADVLNKRHATVRKLQERALQRLTELRLAETQTAGGSV
jgi:RNA polymerase sigma-70 factor (ECF subfamily)